MAFSRPALAASLFLTLSALTSSASAAPLYRTFGGPAGFGTGILNGNDDGSTSVIDLTGAFEGGLRFYGGPYTSFFVNNNGNITFNGALGTYTPRAFPIASQPMIAPYWGDVDTRNRAGLAEAGENLVYYHLEPGRLIVTWYNVGYFANHNERRMSFQLIITNANACGSGDFDVEFRYDRCEWVAGGASGDANGNGLCDTGETTCVPAQAGFDAGNLTDFVALPGSFTPAILNLCSTSNVGTPGVWEFSVRSGGVTCREDAPCELTTGEGPCRLGRTQCESGVAVCRPITTPVDELCDGVDNDCNGTPDDAPELCPAGLTCSLGTCVPGCFEGACDPGYTCEPERQICIEDACVGVTCAADQRCEGGECIDACTGIVCPHDRICVSGSCVDPCSAVTCEAGRVCRDGICVLECPCSPCPIDEICSAAGTCTPRGCSVVSCGDGRFCSEGRCYDACENAICPRTQTCVLGECITVPRPDGGVGYDSGPIVPDGGPDSDGGGMGMDGGFIGDAGFDSGSRGPSGDPGARNCGCHASAPRSAPSFVVLLGALGLVVARRRR